MIRSLIEIIKDIFWLIVRGRKQADANEIPNAVNQARADAVKGDDAALNADIAAARDRMRNTQASSRRDK